MRDLRSIAARVSSTIESLLGGSIASLSDGDGLQRLAELNTCIEDLAVASASLETIFSSAAETVQAPCYVVRDGKLRRLSGRRKSIASIISSMASNGHSSRKRNGRGVGSGSAAAEKLREDGRSKDLICRVLSGAGSVGRSMTEMRKALTRIDCVRFAPGRRAVLSRLLSEMSSAGQIVRLPSGVWRIAG